MVSDHEAGGDVLVVDAGGSLDVPGREPDGRDLAQRRLKAELIVDGLMLGGLDAMAVGSHDWVLGADWVRDLLARKQAPVLAANLWCDGERPWPASTVVERGGRRIGIVGVTVGEVQGCEVRDPHAALVEAVGSLGEVDLAVGLLPATSEREVAAVVGTGVGLHVLFTATGRHSGADPDDLRGTWAYSAGNRGKHLGALRVEWDPRADWFRPVGQESQLQQRIERSERLVAQQRERLASATDAQRTAIERTIATYEARLVADQAALARAHSDEPAHLLRNQEIPLATSMPEHEGTRKLVDRTLEAIRNLETPSALRGLRHPHRMNDNPLWAGSDTCAACHRAEHAQWASTAHANAWQTLVAVTREMDTSCYACHATGVGLEAGPTAPSEVGPFRDVQCEACHGPAKAHVQDPKGHVPARDPGVQACRTCHDGVQDGGRFDYDTYRPKIVHQPE